MIVIFMNRLKNRNCFLQFIFSDNFYDFEKIYLKYFMKPGVQVFIDFGWDTANLYAPEELLAKDDIEDAEVEIIDDNKS